MTELERKVDKIYDHLFGVNGEPGHFERFRIHIERDEQFNADFYAFKRKAYLLFGFLIGSGVISGGVIAAISQL